MFLDKAELFLRLLNARWRMGGEEAKLVARLLGEHGLLPGARILDLGCGNGRIAVHLARHGYKVVGIDISPLLIEDAQRKAEEYGIKSRVEFITGDARQADQLLEGRKFDAIMLYWTSVLGYYLDRESDLQLLKAARKLTVKDGLLLILQTASFDSLALRSSLCGQAGILFEVDEETLMVEQPKLHPEKQVLENTWTFYRRRGKDLEYVDQVSFTMKAYTLSQLAELAEEAGWKLVKAYHSLRTLEPYKPGLSSINAVFKAT